VVPTEASTTPPASAVVPPPPTQATTPTTAPTQTTPAESTAAAPQAQTPAASVSGAATSTDSGGLGPVGWILLILFVAAVIGGLLLWRSRRTSAWDTEAAALEEDTRGATATRLPPVLTTETPGQRGLSWPPLRTDLIDLIGRWNLLAQRASGERRTSRSLQMRNLLQDLVTAVDAENEALATGRDWMLLRPRVNEAEQALSTALAAQPVPDVRLD